VVKTKDIQRLIKKVMLIAGAPKTREVTA